MSQKEDFAEMQMNNINKELKDLNDLQKKYKDVNQEKIDSYETEYIIASKIEDSVERKKETDKINIKIKKEELILEENILELKKSSEIILKRQDKHLKKMAEIEAANELNKSILSDEASSIRKKEMDEEEEWDKKRLAAKEALTDPAGFIKAYLQRNILEKLERTFSKKKQREVREEREKSELEEIEHNNELIEKKKQLVILQESILNSDGIESLPSPIAGLKESLPSPIAGLKESLPSPIAGLKESLPSPTDIDSTLNNDGIISILRDIRNSVVDGNIIQKEQLRTDKDQFKKDQTTSAAEEIASGNMSKDGFEKNRDVKKPKKPKGLFSNPMEGMKGIIGNIMKKFGSAGKFLMSLGSKFLMPLLTTPVGWGILAGLAVGGLVFAYWDDIMAVVGKIFDKVKGFFSSVGNSISKGISAIGDAISSIIDFFNPLNLIPMIARALLPTKMYDAISGFFGGDSTQEREDKVSRDSAKSDMEDKDIEFENADIALTDAITREYKASSRVSEVKNATAIGITPKGGHMILQIKDNGRHNVPAAHAEIRKAGARVATPEEIQSILAPLESDLAVANLDVDKKFIVQTDAAVAQSKAHGKFKEADKKVKASEQEKEQEKKPGNVVADLVRSGAVEWNVWGDSKILNWNPIKKMDKDTIKKIMDFDDWNDQQTSDLVGLWNYKDAKDIESPKLEPVQVNPDVMKEKEENLQTANNMALNDKVSTPSTSNGNTNNTINAPSNTSNSITQNNIEDKSHDSDFTNLSLNRGPLYGSNSF
jgi:hypothetical protein